MSQPIEISPFSGPRVSCRSTVEGIQKDFKRHHPPKKAETTTVYLKRRNTQQVINLINKAKTYYRTKTRSPKIDESQIDFAWVIEKALARFEQQIGLELKIEDNAVVEEIAALQRAITKSV